jgi:hypothetical protein
MTEDSGTPLTLRRILEQDPEGSIPLTPKENAGADTLDQRLDRLPPSLRAAAREEIITTISRVLDRRLVDVLATGWGKAGELTAAAHRSLQVPGETEIVELVDHEITLIHRPHVDVIFDGDKVAQIDAEIGVTIVLHAVTAVVASGRLSALRSGRADVTARLSIEGMRLAETNRRIELPIEVALGDGIPLVQAHAVGAT